VATSTTFGIEGADGIEPTYCCDGNVVYVLYVLDDYREISRPPRKMISAVAHEILESLVAMIAGGSDGRVFKDQDGRPWVEIAGASLAVSISHSRNVIAVVLATQADLGVGIDVEYIDPRRPVAEMAVQIGMPSSTEIGDFYDGWCRYEALFKATGIVDPEQQGRLVEFMEIDLHMPAGFAGKLVVGRG